MISVSVDTIIEEKYRYLCRPLISLHCPVKLMPFNQYKNSVKKQLQYIMYLSFAKT